MSRITRNIILYTTLIEFGPVIVFFATFYITERFETAALSLACSVLIALIVSKLFAGRLPYFALFSGIVTVVSASASFFFDDPNILILRDTFYDLIFGFALLFLAKQNKFVLKFFFKNVFGMADSGWQALQWRWGVFFVVFGVLNECARLNLTSGEWVVFKQIATLCFILFGLYQCTLSKRERLEGTNSLGIWK